MAGKAKRRSRKAFAHVKSVRRANGVVQHYHRIANVRLPDEYGSPEFARAWAEAEERARAPAVRSGATPGSFGELVDLFEASDVWQGLKPRTQADYGKVRDWLYSYGVRNALVRDLTQARAETIVAAALEEKYHRFAVYVVQYCRRLFNWARQSSKRSARFGKNAAWDDVPLPAKPARTGQKQNRPWTPEEFGVAIENAYPGMARAYCLGLCGFDGGTMFPLEWPDYRDGLIDVSRTKTDVAGQSVIYEFLRPFFEDDPETRKSSRIITNAAGVPFRTLNAFQTASSRFLSGLAAQGLVGEGLTLHGLRHTLGKALADGGGDLRAIQNALRHKTERMALYYSKQADGRQAMERSTPIAETWFKKGMRRPD